MLNRFLLFLLLLNLGVLNVHLGFVVGCHESERAALLKFKQSLVQLDERLSSWEGMDCCKWEGVGCDNVTTHIIHLDLHNPYYADYPFLISPRLDSSLVELRHLNYLDLSNNDFQESQIPVFIGSFKHLRYLNLSYSNFSGDVPSQLGNLTKLNILDLYSSDFYFSNVNNLSMRSDLDWVSNLVSLKYLNMGGINISQSRMLFPMPPSLSRVWFSNCGLVNPQLFSIFSNSTWVSKIQQLDLSENFLEGPLPRVISNMTSLTDLDLSWNNFKGSISLEMRNMQNLEYLGLSSNSFNGVEGGAIMGILGNLCKLKTFDLSDNSVEGMFGANHNRYKCVTYDLEILNLAGNMIGGNLPHVFSNFTSLKYLDLSSNIFRGSIPLSMRNMRKLEQLDLSSNVFTGVEGGDIMGILGNLCKLKKFDLSSNMVGKSLDANNNISKCVTYDLWWLDISNNRINGSIPVELGSLSRMGMLDLSKNRFSGEIPTSIGNLKSLHSLDLSHNFLNGSIPESLGQCNALAFIDLSSNVLQGSISELHLANLSRLSSLDLSFNLLDMNFSSSWSPPFQLVGLDMKSCKVRSQFPRWIKGQTQLRLLDLSDNKISGELPQWIPNINLLEINMSHNQISGQIPYFSSSHLISIDLSYNLFSGQLSHDDPSVKKNIVGTRICQLPLLAFLDLQENKINGAIPDCWGNSEELGYINLSSNNLSGNIPMTIGLLPQLEFLKLSDNSLQGSIPPTLSSRSNLKFLDLGENKLVGNIPSNWDKTTHPFLQMLRLRENQLVGSIPQTLCSLPKLHFLDLAHNSLTGGIPCCFGNLTAMKSPPTGLEYHDGLPAVTIYDDPRDDSTTVVLKGAELQYSTTLKYVINLDLSCNAFVGTIPEEITSLSTLIGLNLSHNLLTGNIPNKIGEMTSLVSLDLSNNNLSGTIPSSMSDLTFLSALNLSYNNLRGQIPTGRQLQSLNDPSSYKGNLGLCGDPLPNKCKTGHVENQPDVGFHDHNSYWDNPLFYFVIFSGFATGFWGVVGSLLLKRRFRWALFQLVENITDYLYVQVMIKLNRHRN